MIKITNLWGLSDSSTALSTRVPFSVTGSDKQFRIIPEKVDLRYQLNLRNLSKKLIALFCSIFKKTVV